MFGSEDMIMVKRKADWTPTMEQRAALEGRQVKCLIASEGHLWMAIYFDRFPSAVRRRPAESDFNICPACMDEEVRMKADRRHEAKPSIATYFAVIAAIEQRLNKPIRPLRGGCPRLRGRTRMLADTSTTAQAAALRNCRYIYAPKGQAGEYA